MIKDIDIQKLKINIGVVVIIVLTIAFIFTFNHIASNPSSMFNKISDQNYQKLTDIKFVKDYEDGVDAIARLKVSIAKEIDLNEKDYIQQNLNYWQDFISKNKDKYELLKGVQK
jgi:LPS O-antigen subunit length determinant protein (WzzB/FepE family)